MSMHVATSTIGETIVVALDGIVDLATVPRLQTTLVRTVTQHPGRRVVVDLDGTIAVDDVALGVLLAAAAHAREHDGILEVVATERRLRARLASTRFDLAVTVVDSVV